MKTQSTTPTTPASTSNLVIDMPVRTKHLAAMFGIKATALRRVLRNMPAYADGVHTNYRWAEKDERIPAIKLQLETLAKDKAKRAVEAKAKLDERAKALATAQKQDAVIKA